MFGGLDALLHLLILFLEFGRRKGHAVPHNSPSIPHAFRGTGKHFENVYLGCFRGSFGIRRPHTARCDRFDQWKNLIAGGLTEVTTPNSGTPFAYVALLFDPISNLWTPTGAMGTG